MTEAEWNACTDPQPMLEFLRGKASDRKLRLFAVACCRRIWHLLSDEDSREAVEIAEQFADGGVGTTELEAARNTFRDWSAFSTYRCNAAWASTHPIAWDAASMAAFHTAFALSIDAGPNVPVVASFHEASSSPCTAIHDILGPLPFRSLTINEGRRTAPVTFLAQAIYTDRAFDRMPILADALEDAGCPDPDILAHCRSGGEHARGCWVVDLLTGRE